MPSGRRAVQPREALKELVHLLGRDPQTAVGHVEAQEDVAVGPRRGIQQDLDRDAAGIGELDGVVGQVHQDLAEPPDVSDEVRRDLGRDEDGEVDALGRGALAEQFGDAVDGGNQVEARDLQPDLSGLDLREIQEIVDQLEQLFARAPGNRGEEVLLLAQLGVEQEAQHPQDAVQRRPDLVAHGCQEVGLRAVGQLGLLLRLLLGAAQLDLGGNVRAGTPIAAEHPLLVVDRLAVDLPVVTLAVGVDVLVAEILEGLPGIQLPEVLLDIGRIGVADEVAAGLAQQTGRVEPGDGAPAVRDVDDA